MQYPILLIGFNRPALISKRISQILSSELPPEVSIHISIDGPTSTPDGIARNTEIRKILDSHPDQMRFKIVYRSENLGLSNHVITAVSEILHGNEGVIVLEDDISISPSFNNVISRQLDLI